LFIVVLAGVIFFFGILTFIILDHERDIILGLYRNKAIQSADLIANDLTFKMMSLKNSQLITENLHALTAERKIQIGLVGKDGLPVFGTGLTIPKDVFEAGKEQYLVSEDEFTFFRPLANHTKCHSCHSAEDKTRGMIIIKSSLKEAREVLARTEKRLFFFAIFLGLTSEAFLFLVLRRTILKPLETLRMGAERLKNGELDHRVNLTSSDEIGELAGSFNQMAGNIEASHSNLEKAVDQRTTELKVIAELSIEVFKGDSTITSILQKCLEAIRHKMGFEYAIFCFVDKETGLLTQEITSGISGGLCDMQILLSSDHPFAVSVIKAKSTVNNYTNLGLPGAFQNLAIIPVLSHQRKRCRELLRCSLQSCPAFTDVDERCWLIKGTACRSPQALVGKEKIYGCLYCPAFPVIGVLVAGRSSQITPSSSNSLEVLASQIASAIENKLLIDSKREDISKLIKLNDISVESLQVLGNSIQESIVSFAAAFSNTDASILWLTCDDGRLQKIDLFRIEKSFVPEYVAMNNSFAGRALKEERCIETASMDHVRELKEMIDHYGFLYAASIPLKNRGIPLGCISLFKKKDFFMTDSEKAIILLFASQAAAALNTSRLYRSLLESEEKYRMIMNDAADAIVLYTPDGKILDVNKKAEEFTGYSKSELLLRHFTEFLPAEEHERALEVFARTLNEGTGMLNDLSLLRRDSRLMPIDVTGSVVEIGGQKVLQAIIRDITERKLTELERMEYQKQLISTNELSDAIFNSSSAGIIVLTRQFEVLKINSVGAEILRLPETGIIGKNISVIYPEINEMVLSDSETGGELIVTLPDGSRVPIGFTNSPLHHSSDTRDGLVIIFRDLTEVKKLQSELRKKEHFETVTMIVSGVAHEVRNPLFGITSIGQILEREVESPQHKVLTEAMLKEAGRMKKLIDDLLIYTKPSSLVIQEVDAGIFFEELKHFAHAKKESIVFSFSVPPFFTFRADRDRSLQVFLNLLNNAIDSAREGISISAGRLNGFVEIRIVDDGPGIRTEHLNKIFDPFFTTKKGGTGLGLPICKKIIEDHGGSITVTSAPGEGTAVIVILPA
jgi:PAS domain S-box-containing protein